MDHAKSRAFVGCLVLCTLVGCVAPKPTPQQRFEPLYRSCRAFQGATAVGVNYGTFGELQARLSTEIIIASDLAQTEEDRVMVRAFAGSLEAYKDSAALWENHIESAKYEWAKGLIVVEGNLEPLVTKYKLAAIDNSVPIPWKGLPKSAVQEVWKAADLKAEEGVKLYLALGVKK